MNALNDAYLHDMLIVDEPESSFDNVFYIKMNGEFEVLYSTKLKNDESTDNIVLMNNNYFNSLAITDDNGNILKSNYDGEVLILTNSDHLDESITSNKSLLCSFTMLEDCDDIEVLKISQGYQVPVINSNPEYIDAPYFIVTGQISELFISYSFKAHDDIDMELRLSNSL